MAGIKHLLRVFRAVVISGFFTFASSVTSSAKPTIGVVLPLTGELSRQAAGLRSAIELAKISSQSSETPAFSLSYADSRSSLRGAIDAVLELLLRDDVVGIYGGVTNVTSRHLSVRAEAVGIPYIIPVAEADSLTTTELKYTFRIMPPFSDFNDALIGWASSVVGAERSVAVIVEDGEEYSAVARDLRDDLKIRWKGSTDEIKYDATRISFIPVINRLREYNPTLLFLAGDVSNLSRFILQCRDVDWMPVAFANATIPSFDASVNTRHGSYLEFVFAPSVWHPDLPYLGVREFVRSFRKEVGRLPDHREAAAFAGIEVYTRAIRDAGTVDRESIGRELSTGSFQTVLGQVNFEHYRQFVNQNRVATQTLQLIDGEWKLVYPAKLKTGHHVYPPPNWSQRSASRYGSQSGSAFPFLVVLFLSVLLVALIFWRSELKRLLKI